MTFEDLKAAWTWRAIPNCSGRFVLVAPRRDVTPRDLVGPLVPLREHRVATARDAVIVAAIGDGGLISYQQAGGAYVHTLNTREGFERKLSQLGIGGTD